MDAATLEKAVIYSDYLPWFETYGRIKPKVGPLITPKANVLQRRLSEAIRWCEENDAPARIVSLKPRQRGNSTISAAILYQKLHKDSVNGLIMGGEYEQTRNLWKMCKTYANNDRFEWGSGKRPRITEERGHWPNGSELSQETAKDPDAGRSGTYQVVIFTEVGRWKGAKVPPNEILQGVTSCVPEESGTLIIQESTAQGFNHFKDTWDDAVELEDMQRGARGNGYIRVFAGWHEFEECWVELSDAEKARVMSSLDQRERDGIAKFGWEPEQIEWRRRKIRSDECKGDENFFDQEYPESPEVAFLSSGRPRFDRGMLDRIAVMGRKDVPMEGMLEETKEGSNRYVWVPSAVGAGVFTMWERPKEGLRYLLSLDTMTGASQVGGKDPDAHSPLVLRAGYWDGKLNRWERPAVVARVKAKPLCRWDIDVLEEHVWRLSQYYGNCMIVPEMNMDRGVVELLKKRENFNLYQREVFNLEQQRTTKAYGWQTNVKTREMVIENLARAVRRFYDDFEGVDIRCPHIIEQMRYFVYNDKGKSEAMSGQHDDDVLSLAIGLFVVEAGTVYHSEVHHAPLPRDLRDLEDEFEEADATFS